MALPEWSGACGTEREAMGIGSSKRPKAVLARKILAMLGRAAFRLLLALSIVIVVLLLVSLFASAPDIGKEWWILIPAWVILGTILIGLVGAWQKYVR